MGRQLHVAVVGAGPSGLAACKELLQEGHSVRCFERNDGIGGIFGFRPDGEDPGVWETCRLTSSIFVTSFSDFFPKWREAVPYEHRHMTHREYVDYLRAYAQAFGVRPHVELGREVTEVTALDGAGWRVSVRDRATGNRETATFDAVAICSGIHRVPYTPPIPGLASFRGQVLHAAHYRTPADVTGRSAVFVGAGESGSEILDELTRHLDRAYLSLRRGVFVIPRVLLGLPNDYCGTRAVYSLPPFLIRRTDAEARRRRRRLGFLVFPLIALRALIVSLPHRERCGEQELLLAPLVRRLRRRAKTGDPHERVEALIEDLRARAGGNQFDTFATKTEAFVEAIADGRCELRPGVREVTSSSVVFRDGTAVEADTIVLCTGYDRSSAPFLRLPESLDLTRLYKKCFAPRYRETLGFIGFLRPPIGAIPPMAEMQSRWFAQLLSGNLELPASEEMDAQMERDLKFRAAYHRQVFDRLPDIVDFSTYMDDVAEAIGAKPRLGELLRRPRLLYKLYTAPFSAVQYRLRGPHARPRLAARLLLSAPSNESAFLLLYVAVSEIARALGWRSLAPALSLRGTREEKVKSPEVA